MFPFGEHTCQIILKSTYACQRNSCDPEPDVGTLILRLLLPSKQNCKVISKPSKAGQNYWADINQADRRTCDYYALLWGQKQQHEPEKKCYSMGYILLYPEI